MVFFVVLVAAELRRWAWAAAEAAATAADILSGQKGLIGVFFFLIRLGDMRMYERDCFIEMIYFYMLPLFRFGDMRTIFVV